MKQCAFFWLLKLISTEFCAQLPLLLTLNYEPSFPNVLHVRAGTQYHPGQAATNRHYDIPQVYKRRLMLPRERLSFSHPKNTYAIWFNILHDGIFSLLESFWQKDKRRGKETVLSGYKSQFSFAKPGLHFGENQGSKAENSVLKVGLMEKLKLS